MKGECKVEHHIVEGDAVSMSGEAFIDANIIYLYNYNDGLRNKHSRPVTVERIENLTRPVDLTSNSTVTTPMLNSFFFHYRELATYFDAAYIRGSVESGRQNGIQSVTYSFSNGWQLTNINDYLNRVTQRGSVKLVSPSGVKFGGAISYTNYGVNFVAANLSDTFDDLNVFLQVNWNGTEPGDFVYTFLDNQIQLVNPTVSFSKTAWYNFIDSDRVTITGQGTHLGKTYTFSIVYSGGKTSIYRNGVLISPVSAMSAEGMATDAAAEIESGWEKYVDGEWVSVEVMGGNWEDAAFTQSEMNVTLDFSLVETQGMDPNTEITVLLDDSPTWVTTLGELESGTADFSVLGLEAGTYQISVQVNDENHFPAKAVLTGTVEITTAPDLVVSENSVNWGSKVQGAAAANGVDYREFVIRNEGTAPAKLNDWSLKGDGTNAFWFQAFDAEGAEVSLSDSVLRVGESLTVRAGVNLEKTEAGEKPNFTLSAASNDENLPTLTLNGSVIVVPAVGTVSSSDSKITVRKDESANYTIVLNSQPTADVTVYLSVPNGLKTDCQTLVFTSENWDVPQTISVSANSASNVEQTFIVKHSLVSADLNVLAGGLDDVVIVVPGSGEMELLGVLTSERTAEEMTDQIPVSEERLSDWDSFFVEFWSENPENLEALAAGVSSSATIQFDSNMFVIQEDKIWTPEGISAALSDMKTDAEGVTSVCVTFTIDAEADYVLPGSQMFWGAVAFVPTNEKGSGIQTHGTSAALSLSIDAVPVEATVLDVPYDLDDDGKIGIEDLIQFAKLFGSSTDSASVKYRTNAWRADFDSNGTVTISDLILFAKNYSLTSESARRIRYAPTYQPVEATDFKAESILTESVIQPVFTANILETSAIPAFKKVQLSDCLLDENGTDGVQVRASTNGIAEDVEREPDATLVTDRAMADFLSDMDSELELTLEWIQPLKMPTI